MHCVKVSQLIRAFTGKTLFDNLRIFLENSEILAFFTKSGFVTFICLFGYFFAIFDYIEDDLNLKALIKASKVS